MKYNITKEQYKRILIESNVNNWIDESIQLYEDEEGGNDIKSVNDKYIKNAKNKINQRITDKFSSGDEHLAQKANEIGINFDYDAEKLMNQKKQLFKRLNVNSRITSTIKKVIGILRKVTAKDGGIQHKKLIQMCNAKPSQTYGMSYEQILRYKDFIDSQDLRYLYDNSVLGVDDKVKKFGVTVNDKGKTSYKNLNFNNITPEHLKQWMGGGEGKNKRSLKFTEDMAIVQMKSNIVDRYLMSEYGISFNVPNFSLGNEKVKGALMINFTSAFRCPAWNECIVKHACYARAGEGTYYDNQKTSNDKKHLMWEACQGDPELTEYVYEMLKAYVVNWGDVAKEIGANDEEIEELISKNFSEIEDQNTLYAIKNHVRVHDVRLNENGDFIGQWLLDEFDRIAGDFKVIGVNTAAYSCRNLNFTGIKNIVINASRMIMEGDAIARYFYAIPEKMYDAFEDTYESKDIVNDYNAVHRVPKPLVNAKGQPNGSFYYKCPCSREDFTIDGVASASGKGKKVHVNCYQCHLCYEAPDEEMKNILKQGNGKFFVFVKAHGSKANELTGKREAEIINKVGVPQSYQVGLRASGKDYVYDKNLNMKESVNQNKPLITENAAANEAYNIIASNAIYSMNEKVKGLMAESKENFFTASVNKILNEKKVKN